MTLPLTSETPTVPAQANAAIQSRFHVSTLAFQRARQLKLGARPRVDPGSHKVVTVAVLEVMADTVSWSAEVRHGG